MDLIVWKFSDLNLKDNKMYFFGAVTIEGAEAP